MVSKGCGRPARFVTRSTNSDGIESLCTSYSPLFATTAPSPCQTILAHQVGRRASFGLDENMGEACTKVGPSGYCTSPDVHTPGKFAEPPLVRGVDQLPKRAMDKPLALRSVMASAAPSGTPFRAM